MTAALKLVEIGHARVASVAGGTEAALTPLGYGGFMNMKALSRRNDEPTRASRPFDRDRDGFVMSEGAGVLVLETLDHARARGARIYCELVGYGSTTDILQWFQDRTADGSLPRPVVVSVSIWVYRALMLAWALWLASRVLRWLPWAARQLSAGQIWKRGASKPQTGTPPPLPQ